MWTAQNKQTKITLLYHSEPNPTRDSIWECDFWKKTKHQQESTSTRICTFADYSWSMRSQPLSCWRNLCCRRAWLSLWMSWYVGWKGLQQKWVCVCHCFIFSWRNVRPLLRHIYSVHELYCVKNIYHSTCKSLFYPTVLHCRNLNYCENNGTCVILEQKQVTRDNGTHTIREKEIIIGCECPEHVLGERCDTGKQSVGIVDVGPADFSKSPDKIPTQKMFETQWNHVIFSHSMHISPLSKPWHMHGVSRWRIYLSLSLRLSRNLARNEGRSLWTVWVWYLFFAVSLKHKQNLIVLRWKVQKLLLCRSLWKATHSLLCELWILFCTGHKREAPPQCAWI